MTRHARRAAWWTACLLATSMPVLAGCLSCQPLLDVHHMLDAPDDVEVRPWTAEDGRAWPGVEALMRATEPGDHGHEDWTEDKEDAFWRHFGVASEEPEKELWFRLDANVYRVRVLTCGGTS